MLRLPRALFAGLPTPLLLLVSFFLAGFLLVPDFFPLLDELALGGLLMGAVSVLMERRRALPRGLSAEPAPAGPLLRGLVSEVKSVRALAAALRAQSLPRSTLDGLAEIEREAATLRARVHRADAYLSRRENDPWQVDREVRRLEEAQVAAEVEGARSHHAELGEALRAARAHAAAVRDEVVARDVAVGASRTLGIELRALHDLLRATQESGAVPELPPRMDVAWRPNLRAVVDGLREARVAEQELGATDGAALRSGRPTQRG